LVWIHVENRLGLLQPLLERFDLSAAHSTLQSQKTESGILIRWRALKHRRFSLPSLTLCLSMAFSCLRASRSAHARRSGGRAAPRGTRWHRGRRIPACVRSRSHRVARWGSDEIYEALSLSLFRVRDDGGERSCGGLRPGLRTLLVRALLGVAISKLRALAPGMPAMMPLSSKVPGRVRFAASSDPKKNLRVGTTSLRGERGRVVTNRSQNSPSFVAVLWRRSGGGGGREQCECEAQRGVASCECCAGLLQEARSRAGRMGGAGGRQEWGETCGRVPHSWSCSIREPPRPKGAARVRDPMGAQRAPWRGRAACTLPGVRAPCRPAWHAAALLALPALTPRPARKRTHAHAHAVAQGGRGPLLDCGGGGRMPAAGGMRRLPDPNAAPRRQQHGVAPEARCTDGALSLLRRGTVLERVCGGGWGRRVLRLVPPLVSLLRAAAMRHHARPALPQGRRA